MRARHALDFIGAVEWLAERFSVPLEYEEESPEVAARRRGEDRRRELLALTAAFYHRVLRESPLAEGARTYLTERGVAWEMAERFQLGYSADEHAVIAGARKRQFADRELEETGITRRGRSGPVDRMTGRLVFTLFDTRGRPIAFAGRRLPPDESGAKYVNSPESPLWHKGSTLYGLHLARTAIAKAEEAIVVEGYTDVIGLVQAGLRERRGIDGNGADRSRSCASCASSRATSCCSSTPTPPAARPRCAASSSPPAADLRVRVALPPRGSDPAEVAAAGREAVDRMLAGARSVLAFRVSLVLDAADVGSADGRDEAYEALQAILRDAPATPERDELVRKAGSRLFLDPVMESQLVARPVRRRAAAARAAGARAPADGRRPARRAAAARARARERRARPRDARARAAGGAHARGAARGARLGARPPEPG